MIALPPSSVAGTLVQKTVSVVPAELMPVIAGPAVGADAGTTVPDGLDVGPAPSPLVAVTVKEYGRPLTSPVTVQVCAVPDAVQCLAVGELVTV